VGKEFSVSKSLNTQDYVWNRTVYIPMDRVRLYVTCCVSYNNNGSRSSASSNQVISNQWFQVQIAAASLYQRQAGKKKIGRLYKDDLDELNFTFNFSPCSSVVVHLLLSTREQRRPTAVTASLPSIGAAIENRLILRLLSLIV
jgi:hypothetical protein